jgi:hypothetical protein
MKDWIYLFIAFILGFFVKLLLGTVCQSQLVEGKEKCQIDIPNYNNMPGYVKESLIKYLAEGHLGNKDSDMCDFMTYMLGPNSSDYYPDFVTDTCTNIKGQGIPEPSFCNEENLQDHIDNYDKNEKCTDALNQYCKESLRVNRGTCNQCASKTEKCNNGGGPLPVVDTFCADAKK